MSMLKIIWSNIRGHLLSSLLSFLLFASGIAIISLLINLNAQVENKLNKNMEGIDMVIGAKGSPMQIVLSAVYHVDFPTGNISLKDFDRFRRNPMVKKAIPLSMGDNYQNMRIVGCSPDYIDLYGAQIAEGELFDQSMEVCLGSTAAKKLGLKIGDYIESTHGLAEEGDAHHAHPFEVSGIFKPTGKVFDQLIVCNLASYWEMHHIEAPDSVGQEDPRQITNILIQYRNPIAAVNLPRLVQRMPDLQAASPAIELNRMFSLLGFGISTIRLIAQLLVGLSFLSIFFSMLNALKERKHELAVMRVMGGSRFKISLILIFESVLISLCGALAGILFSRLMLYVIGSMVSENYNYEISVFHFESAEAWLIFISMLVGWMAAIYPAWKAYRQDISLTLRSQ